MLRRCLEGRNTPFRRVRPPFRAPYITRVSRNLWLARREKNRENRMGGLSEGGGSNSRFVPKPDVAIAREVSNFKKEFPCNNRFPREENAHAKKTQQCCTFNYLKTPFLEPPPFAIPKEGSHFWHVFCLFFSRTLKST